MTPKIQHSLFKNLTNKKKKDINRDSVWRFVIFKKDLSTNPSKKLLHWFKVSKSFLYHTVLGEIIQQQLKITYQFAKVQMTIRRDVYP